MNMKFMRDFADGLIDGDLMSTDASRAAGEMFLKLLDNVESQAPDGSPAQVLIASECDSVKTLLLSKNREYGNSALEPIGVFAAGVSAVDQIAVRIDDKLKRIQTTRQLDDVAIHEDTEQDLIGYLVLLRVARKLAR